MCNRVLKMVDANLSRRFYKRTKDIIWGFWELNYTKKEAYF
jgi:hypothetical protein